MACENASDEMDLPFGACRCNVAGARPPQLENNDENRIPHFCSQKITSVAAGGVFVAGLMGAPAQAADGNFAEDADVSTTEILVTYAEEVLTAGEGEDVESVD